MDWQIVLALIGAFGGLSGLAALWQSISTARQSAKKTEIEILRETIEELRLENQRMKQIIGRLEQENIELKQQIENLEAENDQLRRKLNMTPFRKSIGLARHDN